MKCMQDLRRANFTSANLKQASFKVGRVSKHSTARLARWKVQSLTYFWLPMQNSLLQGAYFIKAVAYQVMTQHSLLW